MPLLTGNWLLNIQQVLPDGNVVYTMDIAPLIALQATTHGFWDEASQTIRLHLDNFEPTGPLAALIFKNAFLFEGCQFQMPAQAAPGQDVTWNLAGLFTAFASSSNFQPNSRRNRFGWRATKTQPI
jgi:hypothetical protein